MALFSELAFSFLFLLVCGLSLIALYTRNPRRMLVALDVLRMILQGPNAHKSESFLNRLPSDDADAHKPELEKPDDSETPPDPPA